MYHKSTIVKAYFHLNLVRMYIQLNVALVCDNEIHQIQNSWTVLGWMCML
jgi:hypothetical protein